MNDYSNITDDMISQAAKAVRGRLERMLEFQIPDDSPDYMEVRKAERTREAEWARRREVADPLRELDPDPGTCDGCGGQLTFEHQFRWAFAQTGSRGPVLTDKLELMVRCDKCGLIGVPCGTPSVRVEA